MIVFHTDLDNTLIYSYKRDIGEQKRCVENYQGREISFVTQETYRLLHKLSEWKEQVLIVPMTTRTAEQYARIDLGIGGFRYALVCNGGVLLVNNSSNNNIARQTKVSSDAYEEEEGAYRNSRRIQEDENKHNGLCEVIQEDESQYGCLPGVMQEDENWYRKSLEMIQISVGELHRALEILSRDSRRNFELRFIKELFVFTKCEEPEAVVADLKKVLNTDAVDVFNNGVKVYVVPKALNKGRAVERFREYIGADYVIAAGDSEFDISMLEAADLGLAPPELAQRYPFSDNVHRLSGEKIFAEMVLEKVYERLVYDSQYQERVPDR